MSNGLFKISVVQHGLHDCWLDVKGQPCSPDTPGARFVKARKVPAGTPGAQKVKKKSTKWYGRVPGNPRPIPLSANKVAAQQLLAERVKKAELGRAGIPDPFEEHRKRTCFAPAVRARGGWKLASQATAPTTALDRLSACPGSQRERPALRLPGGLQCVAVFAGIGARFLGDIDAHKVECWLAEMRKNARAASAG
jgi:hypothetical protein